MSLYVRKSFNEMARSRPLRPHAAYTLIELLVAMFIIGVLMSLLLAAVNEARKSARRVACQNHVKQLALACLNHENAHGHLPTGGWGGAWVGDSRRGFGLKQPGGWTFNVLPYIEQDALHSADRKARGQQTAAVIGERLQNPLPVFHCPARRAAELYPLARPRTNQARLSIPLDKAAKTDYAANAGDQEHCELGHFPGPDSLAQGDDRRFAWPDLSEATGISFLRSRIRLADVHDGAGNVYLLGEKSLDRQDYRTGKDHGDDWSAYTGYQDDTYRGTSGGSLPRKDRAGVSRPYTENCSFGSPHHAGWHAAFCDGSVRMISYDLDATTHARLGNRQDGEPIGNLP